MCDWLVGRLMPFYFIGTVLGIMEICAVKNNRPKNVFCVHETKNSVYVLQMYRTSLALFYELQYSQCVFSSTCV